MISLPHILIIAPPVLIALTFHEFSHAYIAYKLGDSTAKDMGRLTLNPLKHLDLMGTIMVFIIRIGWAKPVPVNPMNFKNPRKDLLWVSLAGPLSNILLAFVFGQFCKILGVTNLDLTDFSLSSIIGFMCYYGMIINLMLAFFNIMPIPPLDGSKILAGILPPQLLPIYEKFMQFGHFILLGLIVLNAVTNIRVFSYIYFLVDLFTKFFIGV